MNTPTLQIDGIIIPVTPHPEHEFTMTTADVAAGYGVDVKAIRAHKARHEEELFEGKHFVEVSNPDRYIDPTGATNCSARKSASVQNLNSRHRGLKRGNDTITLWTKRGIIRLGFFIKSERARRFRDMAEDLVLREWEQPTADHSALIAAISGLTSEIRELRRTLAAPRPAASQPLALPRKEDEPIAQWIVEKATEMVREGIEELRASTKEWLAEMPETKAPKSKSGLGRAFSRLTGTHLPVDEARRVEVGKSRGADARGWRLAIRASDVPQ